MADSLTNLAPGLWTIEKEFTNELGAITSRMTVIRLDKGGLFIHSPVPIDPNLRAEVARHGRPEFLIAPNMFHHEFVTEWLTAFPRMKAFCNPGLVAKRSDIKFEGTLDSGIPFDWSGEVAYVRIDGISSYDEIVFFHHSSRTLIISDIVFNYTPAQTAADPGAAPGLGPHDRIRAAITDENALRESIKMVLRWPFDRVILAHGELVETSGYQRFQEGFRFLNV
jgi:hypothetical protein